MNNKLFNKIEFNRVGSYVVSSMALLLFIFILNYFAALPTIVNKLTMEQRTESSIGLKYSVPSTFKVITPEKITADSLLSNRGVVITDMKLNNNLQPYGDDILYMPTDGGIGGYSNGEMPLYRGFRMSIRLVSTKGNIPTVSGYKKITTHSGSPAYMTSITYRKGINSGKSVGGYIQKDNRLYSFGAVFRDTKEYNQVFNRIIESVELSDSIATDVIY